MAGTRFQKSTKPFDAVMPRSEEHTSELQSPCNLVCRLLLEKNNDLAHQRLGGLRERRFAAAALVPGAAAHMPASHAAAGVAAGLDLAPAHGVVAQHRGGLPLLRLLVGLRFRCLGRVQRGSSYRSGFGDFLVGLLLFGFPA